MRQFAYALWVGVGELLGAGHAPFYVDALHDGIDQPRHPRRQALSRARQRLGRRRVHGQPERCGEPLAHLRGGEGGELHRRVRLESRRFARQGNLHQLGATALQPVREEDAAARVQPVPTLHEEHQPVRLRILCESLRDLLLGGIEWQQLAVGAR